jgi:hypothetical protein
MLALMLAFFAIIRRNFYPHHAQNAEGSRLMKRVKLHSQWRWCRLAVDPKGQPKRDVILVKGREQRHPEGVYALFWKENGRNRTEPAGKDFPQAAQAKDGCRLSEYAAVFCRIL